MKFLKILLAVMFFPITIVVLLLKPKRNKTKGKKRVMDIEEQHFALMKLIDKKYSGVISSKRYFGEEADKLISLCIDDITLSQEFWKAVKHSAAKHPVYPSYRQLATLYEKRGEYEKAEKVCLQAIRDGYDDDGTSLKMSGRLKRIKQKIK